MGTSHLVQYQGSKRNLAPMIINLFPNKFNRLIEPFAGSAAISLACAHSMASNRFLINDINAPLIKLLELTVNEPGYVSKQYKKIWDGQHDNPLEYYNHIRELFNETNDPILFLYLLARCVKGAVRYNNLGKFNQSPDKRRLGTTPQKMEKNIFAVSGLLKGKSKFMSKDYREILKLANPGDLVYMDPPYQGVCRNKDSRYYSRIHYKTFVEELEILNQNDINYVISYDGQCGNKAYGEELPKSLNLKRLLVSAGRSSQATLLGRDMETIESIYISNKLAKQINDSGSQSKAIKLNIARNANEERIF
ncbi:MAG TPA: DNA adenine methylase [Gammaproteobacteria bacterium]|nr:DNA adenine methylase [Gammaproteobacteria bacterium]